MGEPSTTILSTIQHLLYGPQSQALRIIVHHAYNIHLNSQFPLSWHKVNYIKFTLES